MSPARCCGISDNPRALSLSTCPPCSLPRLLGVKHIWNLLFHTSSSQGMGSLSFLWCVQYRQHWPNHRSIPEQERKQRFSAHHPLYWWKNQGTKRQSELSMTTVEPWISLWSCLVSLALGRAPMMYEAKTSLQAWGPQGYVEDGVESDSWLLVCIYSDRWPKVT